MMNPVPWLQMTNMISYQGLVRTFPNINAMKNMLASDKYKNVDSVLVHYTKVESDLIKKQGAVLTAEQAQRMSSEWTKLSSTLQSIFPDRVQSCRSDKK
ncbi:hypothetical protein G5613_00005 [Klebsiella pneumoniae]|nr:hypothetical protein [Klebsiella pneumoniae]NGH12522.1 hypothetical protein [Klebsiella pneumoniae]NGH18222.1 hypothetical protein [Klebsiella pneumoniae]